LVYKKDRNGNEVKYVYDFDDKIICRRNAADPADTNSLETYAYNLDGTLKEAFANGIRYNYAYDKAGRQIEKRENNKVLLRYEFNGNGWFTGQTDISGKRTVYTLDAAGRIEQVDDDDRFVAAYKYNDDSTIKSTKHLNGARTEYEYDTNKNTTRLVTTFADGSVFTDNSYSYDYNGNQVKKVENGVNTLYALWPWRLTAKKRYKLAAVVMGCGEGIPLSPQ
jgi:YD repeat-containing protein